MITAGRQQLSFENAFPALITELIHVNDLFEAHGKVGGVMMLGFHYRPAGDGRVHGFAHCRCMLYFDLLDRKVEAREGRVVAREEQINRAERARSHRKILFSPCDT